MAIEHREGPKFEWSTFFGVSKRFGMSPETLKSWVRKAQIDSWFRPGLSSDERARLKALEREVKDLRRANAILQDASIFLATVFDGQIKR